MSLTRTEPESKVYQTICLKNKKYDFSIEDFRAVRFSSGQLWPLIEASFFKLTCNSASFVVKKPLCPDGKKNH